MRSATQLIEKYHLEKHPEGGYFRQTYCDSTVIKVGEKTRNLATSIYFLLRGEEQSALHCIKNAAETWYYHAGSPIVITIINPVTKKVEQTTIGSPADGFEPQFTVPANQWFGAECLDKNKYSFCGCVVTPGFDYDDFSLMTKDQLLELLPDASQAILNLINVSTHIVKSTIINAPPEKVWSIISDFNALPKWHPAIADSYIEQGKLNGELGCVRNFNLKMNGGNIREELIALDHKKWLVKYKILDAPLFLSNYAATLKLESQSMTQTNVIWECHFDCHEKYKDSLHKTIGSDVFQAGFDALKNMV